MHVKARGEEVDARSQYKAPLIQNDRTQAPSRRLVTGPCNICCESTGLHTARTAGKGSTAPQSCEQQLLRRMLHRYTFTTLEAAFSGTPAVPLQTGDVRRSPRDLVPRPVIFHMSAAVMLSMMGHGDTPLHPSLPDPAAARSLRLCSLDMNRVHTGPCMYPMTGVRRRDFCLGEPAGYTHHQNVHTHVRSVR